MRIWKSCDVVSKRPPPMIVETFLDTQDLTNNQSLVIVDDLGRRWDVEEALNKSPAFSIRGRPQPSRPEVVVERWVIQLGESLGEIPPPHKLKNILPHSYKDGIVFFRSLYAYLRLLPAWKFGKRWFKERSSPKTPKLKYRITAASQADEAYNRDLLYIPLFDSKDDVVETFDFDAVDCPAGPLSVRVTYRYHCDFRVDDSEAFLSSRFMGMDEDYFQPSLGRTQDEQQQGRGISARGTTEVGSLPSNRRGDLVRPGQGQAYGSMSTFHQVGPLAGTSPLSALRAARVAGSESPEDTVPKRAPPNTRSAQGSRSSLRSADGASGVGRRPSVSFMPFKSPSLSASPSQAEQMMASARGSLGKGSPLAALNEARNPSLSPYGSVPSRGSPIPGEQAVPSPISSSPKPAPPTRISSSFGHRKSKLSTGGSSRTEDDTSSGKASINSSIAQPGSGVLAEVGGASSGSIQTDDDNISDFLKMLDQKKDLKSFRTSNDQAASEASTRRTSAALSKFQRMKDSNDALSNSMHSSLYLHRSSSSSSRQLSSVPPMVAGTSMSPASSPGKPVSPHTPHTPTIPSRLSAESTIEYSQREQSQGNHRRLRPSTTDIEPESTNPRDPGTGAIDIPNSPRPFHPSYRRSSSAAHQPRTTAYYDDDLVPFGMRSASLGVEDRPPPSLDALAGYQEGDAPEESAVAVPSVDNQESVFGPMFDASDRSTEQMDNENPTAFERREDAGSLRSRGVNWPRIGRGSGRGPTPPHGSSSSLGDRGSGSGSSDQRGGRSSFTRPPSNFEDEEPLLFAMSDLTAAQQSRRSLEDGRGGFSGASHERGGDSGSSSRRGSRRGHY